MGQDNQPKHRQAVRDLRRRVAQRQPAERLLIVCEGSKTEPLYLRAIQQSLRLPTANVQVQPTKYGTEPLRVVEYAEQLFVNGSFDPRLWPRSFDRVVAVFDRDDHKTYDAALEKAAALNGRLKNDENVLVPFDAITSVPCFEIWLLLHFEEVLAPLHRHEVLRRLQQHLPNYAKGQRDHWVATQHLLHVATKRARILAPALSQIGNQHSLGTTMYLLVERLQQLKNQKP